QVRPEGTVSNTVTFTVQPPAMTNVTVANGQVTITGSGFGTAQGDGQVWLGTGAGTVTSWSDTQIVATIPSGAGPGNVQVLHGGVWGNAVSFAVSGPPQIGYMTPNHGGAGTTVTMYGTGFGSSQGSGTVRLSGVSMSVTS